METECTAGSLTIRFIQAYQLDPNTVQVIKKTKQKKEREKRKKTSDHLTMHRQMSGSTTVKPKTKTNKIIKKLKDLSFILDSQSPDAT